MMGFIGETLIFILSGVIIGTKVLESDNITYVDWLKLLGLFVILMLIRGVVVLLSYPILSKYAYGFSWQQAVILVYGGLRGAVGLALALIVNRANGEVSDQVRHLTLFHVAGIAVLTLMINATTTGYILDRLGLTKMSKSQKDFLLQISKTIYDDTYITIRELKTDKYLKFADWEKVEELSGVNELIKNIRKANKIEDNTENDLEMSGAISGLNIIDPDSTKNELRTRFYCILKGLYWHEYEKGQCSARTVISLISSCEFGLDNENSELFDWDHLEHSLVGGLSAKIFLKCKNLPLLGRLFTMLIYNNLVFAYDIACTFIVAHMSAESRIEEVEGELNSELIKELLQESSEQVKKCNEFVSRNISDIFCEILRDIETKKATQVVLNKQKLVVDEYYKHGFLDEKEYGQLIFMVKHRIHKLSLKSLNSSMPMLEEILNKIEFFDVLKQESLETITNNAVRRIFNKGECLLRATEVADGVWILLRGKVLEKKDEFSYEHSVGSIIGVQNLLRHVELNLTNSYAKTLVYAAFLKKEHFPDYSSDPEVEQKLWQLATPTLIKLNPATFLSILATMDYDRLRQLLGYCMLAKYAPGEEIDMTNGAILVHGEVNFAQEDLGAAPDSGLEKAKIKHHNGRKHRRGSTLKMSCLRALHFIEPSTTGNYYSRSYPCTTLLLLCQELLNAWSSRNSLGNAVETLLYRGHTTLFDRGPMDSATQRNMLNRRSSVMLGLNIRRMNAKATGYSTRLHNLDEKKERSPHIAILEEEKSEKEKSEDSSSD